MTTISNKPRLTPNAPTKQSPAPKLPSDRDESPDPQSSKSAADRPQPRGDMKQAYRDLQNGLVDTDLHGMRGVEKAVKPAEKKREKK